MIEILN